MKVFTCNDHDLHYPVGGASIVIALNKETAEELLKAELKKFGLDFEKPFTLKEINLDKEIAIVLADGDY